MYTNAKTCFKNYTFQCDSWEGKKSECLMLQQEYKEWECQQTKPFA